MGCLFYLFQLKRVKQLKYVFWPAQAKTSREMSVAICYALVKYWPATTSETVCTVACLQTLRNMFLTSGQL